MDYTNKEHIQYVQRTRGLHINIDAHYKVLVAQRLNQRLLVQRKESTANTKLLHARNDHHVLPVLSHTTTVRQMFDVEVAVIGFVQLVCGRCGWFMNG